MRMGQRKLATHSLSGFEASQMPEAMMGIEHMMATKFSTAVMLLLTPIIPILSHSAMLLQLCSVYLVTYLYLFYFLFAGHLSRRSHSGNYNGYEIFLHTIKDLS